MFVICLISSGLIGFYLTESYGSTVSFLVCNKTVAKNHGSAM